MARGKERHSQRRTSSGSEVSMHFASSSRNAGLADFAAAAARMTPFTNCG